MKIAIGVVGHESRRVMAVELADRVEAEVLCIDDSRQKTKREQVIAPEKNHLDTWEWLKESHRETDWTVVLEDDAIVRDNFREQLEKALTHSPTSIVSLYLGRGRPPHWQSPIQSVLASPVCWFTNTHLLSCVGVAIRSALVPTLVQHLKMKIGSTPHPEREELPIDELMSKWCQFMKIPVSYSNPSLVDHNHEIETSIQFHKSEFSTDNGYRNKKQIRKAWNFKEPKFWDRSSVPLPTPVKVRGGYTFPLPPGN